jgi:phage minor structural protein
MIYTIKCDSKVIYDSRGEELACENVRVTLEVNAAGSLEFTMPPTHPYIDAIRIMKSVLQVYRDGVEIFRGRPTEVNINFFGKKQVYCEGVLAYLNDSVQRQGEYHDITPYNYLNTLLTAHNAQVEENRRIYIGDVTVTDSNNSLYRFTNYNPTLQEIKEDLVDDLGGYLFPRFENGNVYLDYLADYPGTCTQRIVFGLNLMDYTRNFNVTDMATRIIPLGAQIDNPTYEALGERVTIKSVNGGLDYIQSDTAVQNFGIISKTVIWDNVTTPSALLSKAREYLSSVQYDTMVIEARAVDLHMVDPEIEAFELGDVVNVKSVPHGLDRNFPVTKMVLDLNSAANNSITLGTADLNKSISGIIGGGGVIGTGGMGSTGGGGSTRDGVYFTPSVDQNGDLSWTNNGDLPNPATVNIKGENGLGIRTTVQGYLYANGWDNSSEYSFESDYPHSRYDIEITIDGARATAQQYDMYGAAKLVGFSSYNKCKALGTVPSADIPILISYITIA